MTKSFIYVGIIATLLSFFGCNEYYYDSDISRTVDSFATAYVNYDFQKARRFSTDDSEKWISYTASNITKSDIDFINKFENATTYIDDIDVDDDAGIGFATVVVNGWVKKDCIGLSSPKVVEECTITFKIVKNKNGKWLVKMEGPLQNVKYNLD